MQITSTDDIEVEIGSKALKVSRSSEHGGEASNYKSHRNGEAGLEPTTLCRHVSNGWRRGRCRCMTISTCPICTGTCAFQSFLIHSRFDLRFTTETTRWMIQILRSKWLIIESKPICCDPLALSVFSRPVYASTIRLILFFPAMTILYQL